MRIFSSLVQLSVFGLCILLASCGSKEDTAQATQRLMVVNVLSPDAYADAHIKGSINVPFDKLEEKAQSWNKNTRIVVYCANYFCAASAEAARRLQKMGFVDVFAYEGGTAEWKQKGFSLQGPAKEGYLANVGSPHGAPADIKLMDVETLKREIENADKAGMLITE